MIYQTMKKTLFTVVAAMMAAPLFAQTISWDLSPVTSSLRSLVPNLMGILLFVALVGWTIWNLVQNWKDRAEIITNAGWGLLIIGVCYGIVYGAMNVLLQ